MKMMARLFYLSIALVVMNAGHTATTTTTKPTTTTRRTTTWPVTTGSPQSNLNGKMVTLSLNGGGISFYPPHYYASSSSTPTWTYPYPTQTYPYPTQTYPYPTRTYPYPTQTYPYPTRTYPYPTRTYPYPTQTYPYPTQTYPYPTRTYPYPTQTYPYPTRTYPYPTRTYPYPTRTYPYPTRTYTTQTYPPWTTAYPTSGLSVCVRYLTDFQRVNSPSIFTLSPSSRTALKLSVSATGSYILSWDRFSYYTQYMKPNIRFWSNIGPDIWTRVCLTVDPMKNVAQVFSGSNMSIRKILPVQYVWSGEPVIDFSGFDGQVTDVQMWDYTVNNREIFNYMTRGVFGPYGGSVLTWSNINYSLRGNTLLEDSYDWQENRQISRRGRGRRQKWERKVFISSGRKEGERPSQL